MLKFISKLPEKKEKHVILWTNENKADKYNW